MKENNAHGKANSVAGQIMMNLIENAPMYLKIVLPIVQGYVLYRLFWLVVEFYEFWSCIVCYCFHSLVDLIWLYPIACLPGHKVG